jgi:glycosyltransferase involved in cell wall biosynthesis
MKLVVIIPAFNESSNIARVISETKSSQPSAKIVVVNDCSTDDTEAIVKSVNETALSLPCNLGIGGAVQTGLRFAQDEGYEAAVQVDGDGQHIPSEIEKLMTPIVRGEADVVIGSRFLSSDSFRSTFARRVGIRILSVVNSALTGSRITDSTSGFRAYNRRAICFLSEHYPQDYPEPIAVIDLFRNGYRIVEVPVKMRERQGGTSSISAVKSIYYMTKVLVASLIAFTRKPVSKEAQK